MFKTNIGGNSMELNNQNTVTNSMCVERGNSILHRAAAYPPRSAGTSIQATQS